MSIRLILWLRLFIGAILLIEINTAVGAQDCPARPLPLEQARDYIEKTPAKNAGLLWRVEKSGRTSWLYGTMHLMHIDYAKPGPQIMMGMRSSDILAVEINFYEPQQPVENSQNQKFELSKEQLARLQSAYQKECIKEYPAQPALNLLMISQANRQGLFDGYGPDARLMQIAKRMNKPIVQLETVEQQIKALTPRSQLEFSEQVNSGLKSFENGTLFSHLGGLAKAWQRNDLQTFVQDSERMNEQDPAFAWRINYERNILMAGKIDDLHIQGNRVFVAVGAFHMTGKHGIPKLLEEKGYTVTFVPLKNGRDQ
jgi:uncharacterized protein YbaP (TraB family)